MTHPDAYTNLTWRKSSFSGSTNDCVEIAEPPGQIAVRDSKDPSGPVLTFSASAWSDFIAALHRRADLELVARIAAGELDAPG